MSTIVVVRKDGVAAIGADTQTMYGSMVQTATYIKNHSKMLTVGESRIAYTGSAALGHILSAYFRRLKHPPALDSPDAIFDVACELHKAMKDDYFLRPEEDEDDDFESSRMELLIANPSGIFTLSTNRSVEEMTRFLAVGHGDSYAMGAMYTLYDTDATAEQIARAGLEAAAEFDDSTGRPLEVHTIALKDSSDRPPAD